MLRGPLDVPQSAYSGKKGWPGCGAGRGAGRDLSSHLDRKSKALPELPGELVPGAAVD